MVFGKSAGVCHVGEPIREDTGHVENRNDSRPVARLNVPPERRQLPAKLQIASQTGSDSSADGISDDFRPPNPASGEVE